MCHAVNIWWLFPMCSTFIQLVIVKCQNHECKSIKSLIQRSNRVATRVENFRHLKTHARSHVSRRKKVKYAFVRYFLSICVVSFNLRIGSHKKLPCATLKCKTNFNDRQWRNEVYERLNIELSTWKLDLEKKSRNQGSMCFAEVQVLKLLLEHGTY